MDIKEAELIQGMPNGKKLHERPAKTQISLRICKVCPHKDVLALGPRPTHRAPSEVSYQTARRWKVTRSFRGAH